MVSENEPTRELADFSIISDKNNTYGGDKVVIELLDKKTGALVWARSFDMDQQDSAKQTIVEKMVREITVQVFSASKRALEDRDPDLLTA